MTEITSRSSDFDEAFQSALEVPLDQRNAALDELAGAHPERAWMLRSFRVEAPRPEVPATIGPYRILSVLGEGGMGTVYLAEQKDPLPRQVALKVVKPGMDTRQVLARFETERRTLALMQHECIARVFDAGATPEGRPYFVMELVQGVPITRYCDEQKLALAERIALFQRVCDGVRHAHEKGVIHRDLKPGNVLVTLEGGRPVPKIIDFGIARATSGEDSAGTLFTIAGAVIGTPEYMSPEQAGAAPHDLDTRTDVYSLGVMLYELLTGERPFSSDELRRASLAEMQRILIEKEPPRPSTRVGAGTPATRGLSRSLSGDLDWIVMKALEKDRARRYGSPSDLAQDLERHLRCEPVLAGPPTAGYRLRKFVRRYRAEVTSAGLLLVTLTAGLVGVVRFWLEADAQARVALARKREFDQLAGVIHHKQAIDVEKGLYPPWPDQVDAMKRWLADVTLLLAMRPDIMAAVDALRARALPGTVVQQDKVSHSDDDPGIVTESTAMTVGLTGPGYRFADESQRFLHDTLAELQRNLVALEAHERAAVKKRLSWAENIRSLTLAHPKATVTWEAARKAIAKADGVVASTLYRGQTIELSDDVIMGLVPIGMNPQTYLWEFYELRSAWDGESDPGAIEIPQHIQCSGNTGHIDVGEGTGIVFVLLPGGTFSMGAQTDPSAPLYSVDAEDDEAVNQVDLAPFLIARHEMTQGQWTRLGDGSNPSRWQGFRPELKRHIDRRHPVEQVAWVDATLVLSHHGMQLPTEAQWEFAARAGTDSPWWPGAEQHLAERCNLADRSLRKLTDAVACHDWSDEHPATAPVDWSSANAFGLYGVVGNVWEWCLDWKCSYATRPHRGSGLREPNSTDRESSQVREKVMRGGGYFSLAKEARSANRMNQNPAAIGEHLGVRPVRTIR